VVGLISVITVNLNDAEGLRATAESVAAQERPPEQWIVVDGGSTDGSIEVIRQFEHLIDGWTSAPDRGVYDAMNHGLRSTQGRYVIFMNAGDRFAAPESLAVVAAALRASPEVDLLFGGTILAFPSGRNWYRPPRPIARVRFGLPACHQATAIRRAAHLLAPYDLTLPVSADYGTIAALISRGASSVRLDRAITIRACHGRGLSERATAQRFADAVTVQRQILGLGAVGVGTALARLSLAHWVHRAMRAQWWMRKRFGKFAY
jgi:putative colanic acid biosynthesis glycosyltransferase